MRILIKYPDKKYIGGLKMNILILDKNINNCERLNAQVLSWGNESYISSSMCKVLKTARGPSVIRAIFPVIIFNEALSDEECGNILKNITQRFEALIRISNKVASEVEICQWREMGFTHWIYTKKTDTELKSILSLLEGGITTKYSNITQTANLSDLEKKLFRYLVEAEGNLISREKLCKKIWGTEVSSAKLSYLSIMVTNIRLKFSSIGYPRNLIVTKWKKGYKLNIDIYSKSLIE